MVWMLAEHGCQGSYNRAGAGGQINRIALICSKFTCTINYDSFYSTGWNQTFLLYCYKFVAILQVEFSVT